MTLLMESGVRLRLRSKRLSRLMPCCSGMANPVRHAFVLTVCVLVGWILASIIGVLLYRSSLNSRNKEFTLKCYNHKEVKSSINLLFASSAHPCLLLLSTTSYSSVLLIRVGVN